MQTEKNAAAALSAEDFKVVGFTQEEANRIERPTISYWQGRRPPSPWRPWRYWRC